MSNAKMQPKSQGGQKNFSEGCEPNLYAHLLICSNSSKGMRTYAKSKCASLWAAWAAWAAWTALHSTPHCTSLVRG